MLTLRSKILIAGTVGAVLATLLGYVLRAGMWNPESEPKDWYIGWIVLGVLIVGSIVSVVSDVRRKSVPT